MTAVRTVGRFKLRRLLRIAMQVAVVSAVLAVTIYWLRFAPITVTLHPVEQGVIVAEVMGTGTLEARVQTTISPKISGRIRDILVDQGDVVTADQPLVTLYDDELRQQVAVAEAGINTAVAAIDRLQADVARAAAVRKQAQRRHDRVLSLSEKKATSEDALDEAVESLSISEAGVSHAEAALNEGRQKLAAANKSVNYHNARLNDTTIVAPFDGLVVDRDRDPGDVLVPGSDVLTLISTDELWISAWVDETEMSKLKPGQSARVVFRSEPERAWPGEVIRLGRQTDRATREFIVDVRVKELPRNWAVGQRAEIYVQVDRKDSVVVLPAKRLIFQDGMPGVYVLHDGKAEWRDVKCGLRNAELVEIVEGLTAKDSVVVPVKGNPNSVAERRVAVE